ncbi:glycosyl transferase family 2 [Arcticibacter tournemirensis]|uniref:glycosyltransferase family 2 protein n=1 Tax=Arcticibacter tournemirensis TaxID=699437 RepID=UPI0011513261|nr:glycosyltransferase family 2 protein [Arcticibacter tournemirensis]TQM51504.1 glycosyl transferase family 2 [Arcticibacter tournemirensis]
MKKGFSVIMPTYNQASFIRRAILSLQRQTYQNWELIIINDGCTDETEFFIADFLIDPRIRYIKNGSNKGLGRAINQGLELAEYGYIAYLPSDDFYYKNHLESLMSVFEKYPETFLAFSGIRTQTGDTMVNAPDKESVVLKPGHTLQLVQVAHKRNKERWVERGEWVSHNLLDMYWRKLLTSGSIVATHEVSCFWTDHPNQRHKIAGERFGGGLNQYRAFYKVKKPINMRMSKYKEIDENQLYKNFRDKNQVKPGCLKILIVGELAYNSERIYALEQAGHKLYGLWISKPGYTFNTVGHLPFGNVTDLPCDNWQESINEIKPDVIYALLNFVAVDLAYDVLKANPDIPFVWHFKEGPSICLNFGQWDKLIYLYTYSDGKIYLNETAKKWYQQFTPQMGLDYIMDGDLPKSDYFKDDFSEKLSIIDGHVHTVIVGRMIGISPADMKVLADNNVHVHLYTENYHNCREGFNNEMARVAPNHFHIHPHCSAQDWTKEFSRYDAGWLHFLSSDNNGELLLVSWDDLNIPARISTYASAGLPVILKNNAQHTIAVQTKVRSLDFGFFFNDMGDLVSQLSNKSKIGCLTENAIKSRYLFSFDHYTEDLISFFRKVISFKKDKNEKKDH